MIEFISYRVNMLNGFTTNEILWELPRDFNENNKDFIYLYNFAKDIEDMSEYEIKEYIKSKTDCDFIVEINREMKPKTKRRKTIDITIRTDLITIIYSFGYIGS